MTTALFVQLVVNGLVKGCTFVLIVLGMDIILRGTKILNFAHGQFYMLGAYTLFMLCRLCHVNFLLSLVLSGVALILVGALSYLSVFGVVQRRFTATTPFTYRFLMSAMASVGLMLILQQGTLIAFGTTERGMPSIFPQIIVLGDVRISLEKLLIILLSMFICFGLYLLMYKTKLGLAMRTVSFDPEVASLQGVNSFRMFIICFALGSALAGVAGGIIAPVFAVTPTMGTHIIFTAFLVLLVGGIGSYKGAVLGGVLVGLALSFGFQFWGGIAELVVFVFVIIVLIFKPGGILGEVLD